MHTHTACFWPWWPQLICKFIIVSDIIISMHIHMYVLSHMHASVSVNTHILHFTFQTVTKPSPIKSSSKQVMNGHATGWSLHGWHCGPIWSAFNMGPFACRIIRVENFMDRPDFPRMPHMSFCVEAHSLLNYTHGPCEKFFILCQHATLKKTLSPFTCLYFVFLLQHDVSDKWKAFVHKGFKP